jgi:putative oxidoreductase
MATSSSSTLRSSEASWLPRGVVSGIAWTMQAALAGLFLFAGSLKLIGDPAMVQVFGAIGAGQWFRYFTGTIEVAAATGLLIPSLAPFAAALLAMVMIGASATHLFVVGGSAALPTVLFVVLSIVVYLRRPQLAFLHR